MSVFSLFNCQTTEAQKDVESFIHDTRSIELWSADFLKQITEELGREKV